MNKKQGRATHRPAPQNHNHRHGKPSSRHSTIASREVSATATYLQIAPLLVDDFPECGTPAWCNLPDEDPRWWAGLVFAALQQVLTQDIRQDAEHQASQAISTTIDWSDFALKSRAHRDVYLPRWSE